MSRLPQWQKLPVTLTELCIDTTLRCGQSFRWRKFDDEWRCTLNGRILSLRQDAESLYYKAVFPEKAAAAATSTSTHSDTEGLLRRYFHLSLDLRALYQQWSRDDANFRAKAPQFSGIRILNQDAWEALVCFICSSNNNIARISQMAHKLCTHYGPFLGSVDGEDYHDFPSPAALAKPSVEAHLRELGFGYRAKYIVQTARTIAEGKPAGWLDQLRNEAVPPPYASEASKEKGKGDQCAPTYKYAHDQLLTLTGVGPKVADCVCLMGLGWGEAVPVDTHVWQIAVRDYGFRKMASKTFSTAMHDAVGDHFRNLWGPYAGWAQSVLFTANLRSFADQLNAKKLSKVHKRKGDGDDDDDDKNGPLPVPDKKLVLAELERRTAEDTKSKRQTVKTEVKTQVKTQVKVEVKAEEVKTEGVTVVVEQQTTRTTRSSSKRRRID